MTYKDYFKEVKLQNDFYSPSVDRVFLESKLDATSVAYRERVSGASDYAIAMGANVNHSAKAESGRVQCSTWLRSSNKSPTDPSKPDKSSVYIVDNNGYVEFDFVSKEDKGIVPSFVLNLSALKENTLFGNFKIGKRGEYYHTIEFEKFTYPQTKVSDKISNKLEKGFISRSLARTGKSYVGFLNEKCEFDRNDEYYFEGKKYVRVILEKDVRFNDESTYKKGDSVWFEVQPVKFLIRDWQELPKELNPQGKEIPATNIRLRCEDALISGLSFDFGNSNNWKKSMLRLYLNGEIGKINSFLTDSGKFDFSATRTYDFRGLGFIDELYESDEKILKREAENETKDERKSFSIPKRQNIVEVNNDEMSTSEQIKFYIKNGKPIMLHGPSGVGKSRRIKEIDPECVVLGLRNGMLPEEIVGKTAYNDKTGQATWIAPTWYDHICKICAKDPNKNHVLFIDEITNVRAGEQSLVYNIVLNRNIDGQNGTLPDNCVVVAAGNSIDESSAAFNLVEPLYRRFYAHIQLDVDVKEFLMWGSERKEENRLKIHPLVAAFVAKEGEGVLYSVYHEDSPSVQHVIDPRGWEQVSDIIYDNNEVVKLELLSNKLGLALAGKFVKFAQQELVTPRMIINGTFNEDMLPKKENEIIALILRLRYTSDKREVRKFIEKYYGDEKLQFYDGLSFKKKEDEIEEEVDYVKK